MISEYYNTSSGADEHFNILGICFGDPKCIAKRDAKKQERHDKKNPPAVPPSPQQPPVLLYGTPDAPADAGMSTGTIIMIMIGVTVALIAVAVTIKNHSK